LKVCELYKSLDLKKMEDDAVLDDYVTSALKFVKQVWEREIESLSKKQADWLERIDERWGNCS